MTFVDLSACIFAVRIGREYERHVLEKKHKVREDLEAKTVRSPAWNGSSKEHEGPMRRTLVRAPIKRCGLAGLPTFAG